MGNLSRDYRDNHRLPLQIVDIFYKSFSHPGSKYILPRYYRGNHKGLPLQMNGTYISRNLGNCRLGCSASGNPTQSPLLLGFALLYPTYTTVCIFP